jgi:hypothetical protein
MNFIKGKMYFLRFFYTGTNPDIFAIPTGITSDPQKYINMVLGSEDFDEGFVIITASDH